MTFSGYDLVEANISAPYACLFYHEPDARRYAASLREQCPENMARVVTRKIRVDGHTWPVFIVIESN